MDFGKQNCNISEKPITRFTELLCKFISGFDTVLGLSELRSGEACELRDRTC